MILVLVILACFSVIGKAFNFDYDPPDNRVYEIKHRTEEDDAPEPVVLETVSPEPVGLKPDAPDQFARSPVARNPVVPESVAPDIKKRADINKKTDIAKNKEKASNVSMCDDFIRYSTNCTVSATQIYKSTRKTPPDPRNVHDWCKAIKQLTSCAIDWNTKCGAVNENRFDEDSIKGHKHVLDNFCDDEWFISQYTGLGNCISDTADAWEKCYLTFKAIVDDYKNSSRELTHYEVHFHICCARTSFRRCTLDVLFASKACIHDEVLIVQKFSAIVSEGDVFQNCDFNMVYTKCTGGDPRPNTDLLTKLVAPDDSGTLKERASPALIMSMLLLSLCRSNRTVGRRPSLFLGVEIEFSAQRSKTNVIRGKCVKVLHPSYRDFCRLNRRDLEKRRKTPPPPPLAREKLGADKE